MWCSGCERDFQANRNAVVQICPHCKRGADRQRRVPKLQNPVETPRLRIDNAHPMYRSDEAVQHDLITEASGWRGLMSLDHHVLFGLFIYLTGQVLHLSSFGSGNMMIWCMAKTLSIFGVSIALISAAITLRNLDRRVRKLAKNDSVAVARSKWRHVRHQVSSTHGSK